MQLIEGNEAARDALEASNARRRLGQDPKLEARVRDICESVRQEGDDALLRCVRQWEFDAPDVAALRVTPEEIEAAWQATSPEARRALERAASNIEAFHRAERRGDWHTTSPDGAFLGARYTPIERAGLYAPGGRAVYPSTVLMLAIPARVAGVEQIALATPAGRDGKVHPLILSACRVAGVSEIYKLGGAHAMAAFAFGTATIPRVDKLAGPGSIYVTLAKKLLFGTVGVDGLYGPSEVVVLAEDGGASASQLAADLVAQAEHGEDSWVCFISPSRALCESVQREVEAQVAASPRGEMLRGALENSLLLCPETMPQACALCDLAAPEHLEIWHRDALGLSGQIRHAGAIFLNTPVPLGDYIAGPSHTLPTGGAARFMGGVSVETFLKRTTLVAAPPHAIAALADDLEVLARLEGLPGHAEAVRLAAGK